MAKRGHGCCGLYTCFQKLLQKKATKKRLSFGDVAGILARTNADTNQYATRDPSLKAENRHLVLNFDVNSTIIMSDKIQNVEESAVANTVLACTSWGVEKDGSWQLIVETPSVRRPRELAGQKVISYNEYMEKILPGPANKNPRKEKVRGFTSPGEPGEKLAPKAKEFVDKLTRPDGNGAVFIIPSFFELLIHLKRTERSFTLVFRTFGEDLHDVIDELNAFCEGRHYMSPPDVRLDGSDGEPDYRVLPADTDKRGTFYHDDDSISLIWGTWWQPEKEKNPSLACYKGMDGISIDTDSVEDIGKQFRRVCRQPGTLAMRDYYLYWKKKGFTQEGGKPLFFRHGWKSGMHEIFFDDNIRFDDAFIVRPVDMANPTKKMWVVPLLDTHLCRAEPLESVYNSDYFIKHVARLEKGFTRKLTVKWNLKKFIQYAAVVTIKQHMGAEPKSSAIKEDDKKYDPWAAHRRFNSDQCIPEQEDDDFERARTF